VNRRNNWLAGLAPVVLLAGWGATHEIRVILHERAVARQERERREAEVASIKAFAASTNAIVDWQKTLCNGDMTTHDYATDLEPVLPRADGRGLMFYGELKDIVHTKENADTAVFDAHGCMDRKLELRFTVDAELLRKLQASRAQPIPYFVLTASISNVGKPVSQGSRRDVTHTSNDSGVVIVVKGRAFDVLYIGVDGYQFELDRGDLPTR